jgi:fused signal recognition particle receptor
MADVGIETTTRIIGELTKQLDRKSLKDGAALKDALHEILLNKLAASEGEINFDGCDKPFVMFVVGVNGVGKTTTIGKLASRLKSQGKSVMLAAGDTFRAAAVEQLQVWGERNAVPVIAQHTGADSASVVFDGIQAAKSRGADVIIADTAGRLHNKSNLMEELKKVKRVASKIDEHAPHEILLVLDAGTGQNAVAQMSEFNQVVGVTGIALTKLDGTAKGGIIFALADKFSVPIRYIGVGEGLDDLQPFNASEFVQALLNVEG